MLFLKLGRSPTPFVLLGYGTTSILGALTFCLSLRGWMDSTLGHFGLGREWRGIAVRLGPILFWCAGYQLHSWFRLGSGYHS